MNCWRGLGCCLLLLSITSFANALVTIVAAENSYAQVAQRLGGDYVQVVSLLSQVNQDPHVFTASVVQAKALAQADIVVFNGAGYDLWVENLLLGTHSKNRIVMEVARLLPNPPSNPHLWYDPLAMPYYAKALVLALKTQDPQHANYYNQQQVVFLKEMAALNEKLLQIKKHIQGQAILVAEPLFDPMATYLGLRVLGQGFAKNIMNEVSPTPADIAAFEQAMTDHQVNALIYNAQMHSPLVDRMKKLAQAQKIPMVGVQETQALDQAYVAWLYSQVQAVEKALYGSH